MRPRKVTKIIEVDEPELTEQERRVAQLKEGSDPLGLHSVLRVMAERGWLSVEQVNALPFGPDDVPSLPYIDEAVDILTAMRDKVKAVKE